MNRKIQPLSWYAVRRGRQPGIYKSWRETEKQVYMYSGAEFAKFDTLEKAKAYMDQNNNEPKPNPAVSSPTSDQTPDQKKQTQENIQMYIEDTSKAWKIHCTCPSQYIYHEQFIEKKDVPKPSYAGLIAFTEFLNKWVKDNPYRPRLLLEVRSPHVRLRSLYPISNILQKHLDKWALNLWYTTRGPVLYPDIMCRLYHLVHQFPSIICWVS